MQFRAPVRRRTLSALVVVALLFAQALGLLHSVAHAPFAPDAARNATIPADIAHGQAQAAADLFSHEADEPTCRLFDALACGSAAASHAGAPAAAPACLERPLALQAPHTAPRARFQARGPPVLS